MVQKRTQPAKRTQEFDQTLKALFGKEADKILSYLIPNLEVITDKNVEMDRTTQRADLVFSTRLNGKPHIVDMELQTRGTIEVRMLQYFAGLHAKHGCPVIPVILYPFKTKVSISPYEVDAEDGTGISFRYRVLCLWQMQAQPILDDRAVYLYTLLPAMRGITVPLLKQALKEMKRYYTRHQFGHHLVRFHRILKRSSTLSRQEKREIEEELSMAYAYDWFIDDNPEVRKRVRKSREESLAEGLAKGEARGLIKGEAKGLQQSALLIIGSRFPSLQTLAQPVIEQMTNTDELNNLIRHLATASGEEDIRKLLKIPVI